MKKKLLSILLLLPLLTACPGPAVIEVMPDDFVPELPAYKDKKSGAIRTQGDYDYLDFFEISDFHGAVNYKPDNKELGLAKLSSYYDSWRATNPGGTVLVSSGDMWQGSADSNLTRGTMVTYAMNIMNFDSMGLGNHEFDWTVDWIKNNKNRATFPYVCANLIDKTTGALADFVVPSTVVTRGDYKIGIIGTIGDSIKDSIIAANVANYDFVDEVTTVTAEASRLRSEEGCDVIVWTSHNGCETLRKKPGIYNTGVDIVFGGHTHETYDEVDGNMVFQQSKPYGHSLPHVSLKINKSTKEITVDEHSVDDEPTIRNYDYDQDINMVKKQYDDRFINPVKNQYIASTDEELKIMSSLTNLCVYSMKEELLHNDSFKNYDVVAAFHNKNGGVRKDIAAGAITFGTVYESFPFDNEIVILKVTGETLWEDFSMGNNNIGYWHSYKKGDLLDDDYYYVITTDFLLTHKEYYAYSEIEETIYTNVMVRDAVANTFKRLGNIKAGDYKSSRNEYNLDY